jgi:hypothetical protein
MNRDELIEKTNKLHDEAKIIAYKQNGDHGHLCNAADLKAALAGEKKDAAKAFHEAFAEITAECNAKGFRAPSSTDFGFGWRKALEYAASQPAPYGGAQ